MSKASVLTADVHWNSYVELVMQPGEMSLEDIETRLSPLFESEVITNLKSANWKERLEGEKWASF